MAVTNNNNQMNKPMNNKITKEQWIAMFQDVGLDEAAMRRWHRTFESRHPEAHQSFLEWLGLKAEETGQIRQQSR